MSAAPATETPQQVRFVLPIAVTYYFVDEPSRTTSSDQRNANDFPVQLLSQLFGLPVFGGLDSDGGYQELMDRLFRMQEARGPPPASKTALDKLKEVNITQQEVDQQLECSICKENFELGNKVLKL